MTTIRLATADQRLFFLEKPVVATGDVNSVEIHVDFDSVWDNYGKEAVFFTEKKRTPIAKPLVDGTCKIPSEFLADVCCVFIGVRGVHSDNRVKTTTLVKFKLSEGTPSGGSPNEEPELDVYQKLLASYGEMQMNLEEAYENAEKLISQAYEETKELIAEADEATEGKIAVERARINNILKTDENVFRGYAVRELIGIGEFKYGTSYVDGTTKYCALLSMAGTLSDAKKLHVLSVGVHLSNNETPADNAMFYKDEHLYWNIHETSDDFKSIVLAYETDTKPEEKYALFKVVYVYSIDVDSAYASLAELNDVRVGYDGTVYETAGDAVREQVKRTIKTPETAEVGQVPIVESIDEEGVISWKMGEMSGGANSWHDLAIKSGTLKLIPKTETQFTYMPEKGLYMAQFTDIEIGYSEGESVKFTLDGNTYGGFAFYAEGYNAFGNVDLLNGETPTEEYLSYFVGYSETDRKIVVFLYDADTTEETRNYTIGLEALIVKLTKIPKAFLPETIGGLPEVTEENNGNHLVVENGKWIVKEVKTTGTGVSSWNDLTDKPFGEETNVYFEITEGYEPIEQITTDAGVVFYKVVEEALTVEQIIGAVGILNTGGNRGEFTATEDDLVVGDGVISSHNVVYSVAISSEIMGVNLTQGTWVVYDPTFYLEKLSKSTLKKINPQFLPDELYAEIDDRIDAYIQEALGGEY